ASGSCGSGPTPAAVTLAQEGKLALAAPVSPYLGGWHGGGDKQRVTVRHLLMHSSGLPAYAPLWRELRGRDAYARRIGGMGLDYTPGSRTVYSDFGIMVLGFIIEELSGQTLDLFLDERVFDPLGMRDTGYNPRSWADPVATGVGYGEAAPEADGTLPLLARVAPTELDTIYRQTHVHGVVHDENAYALGGVAGHAGLFSSARDLAVFAQMMLNGGEYAGVRVLDSATIARFTRRADGSGRALGGDKPSGRSSAGDYFSPRAFGHTGFTGNSIWIDPEYDVFVVLLTNRVNPTRDNMKHAALRRAVHDALSLSMTDMPVGKREGHAKRSSPPGTPGSTPPGAGPRTTPASCRSPRCRSRSAREARSGEVRQRAARAPAPRRATVQPGHPSTGPGSLHRTRPCRQRRGVRGQ